MRFRSFTLFLLLTLVTSLYDAYAQQDAHNALADTPIEIGPQPSAQAVNTNDESEENENSDDTEDTEEDETEQSAQQQPLVRRITRITLGGNTNIPNDAILNRLPFRLGEEFIPAKTSSALRNLYNLNYFRQIEVWGELEGDDGLNLHFQFHLKFHHHQYRGLVLVLSHYLHRYIRLRRSIAGR